MSRPCPARTWRTARALALLMVTLVAAGCSSQYPLMPTPHLYSEGHAQLFGELDPKLRSSTVPVFYVTDRSPEEDEAGQFGYGAGRSESIGYGVATVEIGEGLDWQQVETQSLARQREQKLLLELREVIELGRTPPTPFPYERKGGTYVHPPEILEKARVAGDDFHDRIASWFEHTPRKDVLLYVHGYNNDFRDAVLTWAGFWHFFGREGIPIVYSWPAGRGGLAGYAYDRESGEFTVYHLKLVLESLARNENIEGVRILAHSRGADVLTTALRELFIKSWAEGVDPRRKYRIRQLVLAAPDLDYDVTRQRLASEPIAVGIERLSIYVSPGDKALGLSEWLFGSLSRVGSLTLRDLEATEVRPTETPATNVDVIELDGDGGRFGHSYFHQNPAVSSDVLQTLRFDRRPGSQARPLERQGGYFWRIDDGYLLPAEVR